MTLTDFEQKEQKAERERRGEKTERKRAAIEPSGATWRKIGTFLFFKEQAATDADSLCRFAIIHENY
jgi:hypothetical protein